MSEKYKPIKANSVYFGTEGGKVRVTHKEESQLDRVEKNVEVLLSRVSDLEVEMDELKGGQ